MTILAFLQTLVQMNWHPLWLSFEVALKAVLVSGALGIVIAGLLQSPRCPGRHFIDTLVTAPMVVPPTVLGYYVLVLMGRESALGRAFEALTGSPVVFTKTGAIVAAAIGALPFVVKTARAAMEEVDARLVDAARSLGASRLRAFVTITLPLSVGGIAAGLTLGFARALGDFGVTLMVAGNIPGITQTAALAIYDAVQAGRDGDAARMVVVMTAVAIGALYVVNRLTNRRRDG